MRLWSTLSPRSSLAVFAPLLSLLALSLTAAPARAAPSLRPTLALTPALFSSALIPRAVLATPVQPGIPASQRHFRIGHPAAAMSASASLPAQTAEFEGFASSPLIEPTPETAQIIRDSMDLFGARPSAAIFARWSAGAIFADPICHAVGAKQYMAQWYGMPAAFSLSETKAWKLTRQEPGIVEYVQLQRYKVKGLGTVKDMKSTVVIERDGDNRVTRFEDRWGHKEMNGKLGWPFRRLNAFTMPWLISVPNDAKDAPAHSNL
ncbi:uncharacterized protein PAN0_006d2861 [Moesziomyces antarcticus]|uniref:SnoaL-like domain-containing protein n=2 Tax=Pseudozyma antarctica TaxID=84753 RepID=A0A081CDA1_PSEA2|nr:uncharacterized protein PAN0_006d2861 [Moesziomyces antarcticus]GAK64647.1 conserved hypothetical protein [Moesziomyces antarcticus]